QWSLAHLVLSRRTGICFCLSSILLIANYQLLMAAVLSFISTTCVPKVLNRRRLESDSKATANRHQFDSTLLDSAVHLRHSGSVEAMWQQLKPLNPIAEPPGVNGLYFVL